MMIALRAKLDQFPELKQLLLSTAGNSLVEHTENDNYWGDGGGGSGLNRLGMLLVELRENYLNDKLSGPTQQNNFLRTQLYNARVGTILWSGICRQCMQSSWYICGVAGQRHARGHSLGYNGLGLYDV